MEDLAGISRVNGGLLMKSKIKPFAAMVSAVVAVGIMTSCGVTIEKYAPLTDEEEIPDFARGKDKIGDLGESSSAIPWQTLENIDTHPEFRALMESAFGIEQTEEGKQGCLYLDPDGNYTGSNTLLNALGDDTVKQYLTDKDIMTALLESLGSDYSDLTKSDATAAILNAYFDLLPDDGSGKFGGSQPLTRAQAMTLVMRAVTPADGTGAPPKNADFSAAVGDSAYTDYAAEVDSFCFISTEDGSLTSSNFNETMTRAEYIYLIMNAVFGYYSIDSFEPFDVYISDCIQGDEGDGAHSYILATAMANEERGIPTSLYKALAKAVSLGVIDSETKWSQPITKKDALFLLAKAVYKYEPLVVITNEPGESEKTEKNDKKTKKKKKDTKKKSEQSEG